MIGPATAEEGTDYVAAAGSEVEESALHWGDEVKAWVEDVADGCEQRIHIPDQG